MKVGFVNIFGKPNAGKSTLLNALLGEKLAIISPKVQTTRHRIKGILTDTNYQVVLSDTPGIIEPKYKLQEKMMQGVKSALEDADVALLLVDVKDDWQENDQLFASLSLAVPCIVVINKLDTVGPKQLEEARQFFAARQYCRSVLTVSALSGINKKNFLKPILELLPEGEPFFEEDQLTDLNTRFFVGELIREKIFQLFEEEIPYHTTVLVTSYKEQENITRITADIIVQRETQKAILIGKGGQMIRQLGILSRADIEKFIDGKVYLELFVKVRPKWRDNDLFLREYGYF
ncbi:MAG TPA: GTPase Era [Lacibacter sp.]|nr:GTPase Era [Lacibacter sp.]HMO87525.1 GTPase Era [Lacibacter sp.]HMP88173.1 GTPase Era [Lacibacter sp.]